MFSSDENEGSANLNVKSSMLYDESFANNKEIFPNGPISLPLIPKLGTKKAGEVFIDNEEQPSQKEGIEVGNLLKNDDDDKNNNSNINKVKTNNNIENDSEDENNEINDNEENEEKEDEEIQKEKNEENNNEENNNEKKRKRKYY